MQVNFQFYPQLFDIISDSAKDLIRRLSAEQILKHPWLQDATVISRVQALMETQRRTQKRLLKDDCSSDIVEKRQKGEETSLDMHPTGDRQFPPTSLHCPISLFKLPPTGHNTAKPQH